MNRMQLLAMILAGVSVMALLFFTLYQERGTRLALYLIAVLLLGAVGAYLLIFEEPYTEAWGYTNVIGGVYFLLLAVAPLWAAINVIRRY